MTKHDYDVSKREVARAMREAGATYQQIADRLGVTRQRAHQIARDFGAPSRVVIADVSACVALRRAGKGTKEIAATLGVPVRRVRDIVRAHAPDLVWYRLTRPVITRECLASLRQQHMTLKEMAQFLGVSVPTIDRALRAFGMTRSRPR